MVLVERVLTILPAILRLQGISIISASDDYRNAQAQRYAKTKKARILASIAIGLLAGVAALPLLLRARL